MKHTLIAAVLLTGLLAVQAQERLSREEALKYAFATSADLKEMLKTPSQRIRMSSARWR